MFEKIGILYHPMNEAAGSVAEKLRKMLSEREFSTWFCSSWEGDSARDLVDGTDLILSVGGDGTILRAAQAVIPGNVPITGVNLGKLGFMTELSVEEMEKQLDRLLNGEGWIDERCLLEAEVKPGENDAIQKFYSLNDVVVARGAIARVIYVTAEINGETLTTYKADGVIVATATGSTGYALSAGGPVLHPHSEDFLLLPIMPHLSADYRLVLPSDSKLELSVQAMYPSTLSIDGHINLSLDSGAVVTVKRSQHKVRFLRIHPSDSFYSRLEKRLKGKQKSGKEKND